MPDRHLDHVCSAFFILKNMKKIELSKQSKKNKGKYFALVDDEDFERVNKFRWCMDIQHGIYYAVRTVRDNTGRCSQEIMHRKIMNCETEKIIDHIDGNGLNNQKSNLRFCTNQQNQMNRKPNEKSESRFKGVVFDHNNNNKCRALIRNNGKLKSIGYFKNEIDAAKAYDKAAKECFGEFARLNFP